jgi:hypothetical protein
LISPYIAPVVAVAFTWSFLLDPQLGLVNRLALDRGLMLAPIPFFSGRWIEIAGFRLPLALLSVIFFEGWRYFPFAFLFILARLQGIPEEFYHAAAVDGAGPIRRFLHITLPQLATVIVTLFSVSIHLDDQQVRRHFSVDPRAGRDRGHDHPDLRLCLRRLRHRRRFGGGGDPVWNTDRFPVFLSAPGSSMTGTESRPHETQALWSCFDRGQGRRAGLFPDPGRCSHSIG